MSKYVPSKPGGGAQSATSDIQPWGLEFLRFDQLLKAADELAIQVRMYNNEVIHQYWVILYQLYMMMRPYFSDGSKHFYIDINKKLTKIHDDWEEDYKNGYKETPKELIKELTWYHEQILMTKQFIGLGIPMSQHFDAKQKMKNALLGKG